jgi:hypothetical protein
MGEEGRGVRGKIFAKKRCSPVGWLFKGTHPRIYMSD